MGIYLQVGDWDYSERFQLNTPCDRPTLNKMDYNPMECQNRTILPEQYQLFGQKKSWPCQFCDRVLASKPSYDYHIRVHTGEKKFFCDFCPYACILKRDLQNHVRKHTGEKPFGCPHCSYRSAWKSTLQYHLSTHGIETSTNKNKI